MLYNRGGCRPSRRTGFGGASPVRFHRGAEAGGDAGGIENLDRHRIGNGHLSAAIPSAVLKVCDDGERAATAAEMFGLAKQHGDDALRATLATWAKAAGADVP